MGDTSTSQYNIMFINNNHNFIYDDRTRNISKFVMEMEKNNKTFFLVFLDYE